MFVQYFVYGRHFVSDPTHTTKYTDMAGSPSLTILREIVSVAGKLEAN